MTNDTYYYFGAYLKIELRKEKATSPYTWCGEEGHQKHWHGTGYCRLCGKELKPMPDVMEYPYFSTILPQEYDDVLIEADAPKRYRTGFICVRAGNAPKDDGTTWAFIGGYDEQLEEKEFPTNEEIQGMKHNLLTTYRDAIEKINNHPSVVSVTVHCGYIMDAEM